MKKLCFFLVFLTIIFTFSFSILACSNKNENPLYSRVSELRIDIFSGKGENYSLTACYGYKEAPYNNDAKVSDMVYQLTFKLLDKELDSANYQISFSLNGTPYQANFKLNPVTHNLTASVNVENFTKKEFSVCVSGGVANETINLKSIVPEKTIDNKKALDCLYSEQENLIKAYCDNNGNFNAEIYQRIVVKNNKPYWYIGIASGNGNLKALLIDGFSGKTLAIREIF